MANDTAEELERIEKALLEQITEQIDLPDQLRDLPASDDQQEDVLQDDLIREILAEPAFEDMDEIKDPKEPMVYCNYSNDYGRDLETFTDDGNPPEAEKTEDKLSIGLMFTASALCLGLIGVMIYWLVRYL